MPKASRGVAVCACAYLVDWIQHENPTWRIRLASRVTRMQPRALSFSVADWIFRNRRVELANGSVAVFFLLKERGDPATEPLAAIINDPKAPQTARRAIQALRAIGTATALDKLISCIANRHHPFRTESLIAIEDSRRIHNAMQLIVQTPAPVSKDAPPSSLARVSDSRTRNRCPLRFSLLR